MADRTPAPATVKMANALLLCACMLGVVVAIYMSQASTTLPLGVDQVLRSVTDRDRGVLEDVWFIYPEWQISYVRNLTLMRWVGLACLVFIPLTYFIQRASRPARAAVWTMLLVAAAGVAVDTDFGLSDVDPNLLSAPTRDAFVALVPAGYWIHDAAAVAMLCAIFGACMLLAHPASRTFFAPPGLAQPSLAQPSLAQPSLARPSSARPGVSSKVI